VERIRRAAARPASDIGPVSKKVRTQDAVKIGFRNRGGAHGSLRQSPDLTGSILSGKGNNQRSDLEGGYGPGVWDPLPNNMGAYRRGPLSRRGLQPPGGGRWQQKSRLWLHGTYAILLKGLAQEISCLLAKKKKGERGENKQCGHGGLVVEPLMRTMFFRVVNLGIQR